MISLRKGGGTTIFHLPESFGILRRKTREFATWMHTFRTYESRVNPRSLSSKKLRAKKGDSLDASFDCSIQGSRCDDRLKSIEIQEYSIFALPWTTSKILEFIHDWLSIEYNRRIVVSISFEFERVKFEISMIRWVLYLSKHFVQ